jgi:hypothetical protein
VRASTLNVHGSTKEGVVSRNGEFTDDDAYRVYLEIQGRIGELMKHAPLKASKSLTAASVHFLRAKREWLGDRDELASEVPLAME